MGSETVILSKDSEGNIVTPTMDAESGGFVTTDFGHYQIHVGKTYRISTTATALADNAKQEFVLTVGSDEAHLVFSGACGGDATIELYEGSTGVVGTNAVTPLNANRERTDLSSGVSVIQSPESIAGDGTRLSGSVIPGGTVAASVGGSFSQREETVLNPSTVYLLRLTNISGGNQPASLNVEWYEG